jgi:adenine-specific DNA-methyltransferase
MNLVRHLVSLTVNDMSDKDAVVLDFFAGSGTTAHAVMAQNAIDGGCRKYILVQLPEPLDPASKEQKAAAQFCQKLGRRLSLAEITKERIRRSAKLVKDQNPEYVGDMGFRVFKLDQSCLRAWAPDGENLAQSLLEHQDHLMPGRTEDDVLYELLLKLGLDLCVPIAQKAIGGVTVYAVGAGVLLACLAEDIPAEKVEEVAQGIVGWHQKLAPAGDATCVFLDSAFADDVAKTNMAAILQQNGIQNVRSL